MLPDSARPGRAPERGRAFHIPGSRRSWVPREGAPLPLPTGAAYCFPFSLVQIGPSLGRSQLPWAFPCLLEALAAHVGRLLAVAASTGAVLGTVSHRKSAQRFHLCTRNNIFIRFQKAQ